MKKHIGVLSVVAGLLLSAGTAFATATTFDTWKARVSEKARAKGMGESVIAEIASVEFLPRVIELDRKQPEKTITFARYRENTLAQTRINKGREMMQRHKDLLESISKKYGVAPQYIVALWGIETSYGGYTGNFDILSSLGTLAYEGRRREFFEDEFLRALKILNEGHISRQSMKGSWAGAMGQNQFMPSSFFNFAVDHDGDGRKDIWGTHADIFASTANYLARSGWTPDLRWGREVKLSRPIAREISGNEPEKARSLDEWRAMGVQTLWGHELPSEPIKANLIVMDGGEGAAFLVYANFQTIMRWNRSLYFASCVGLLADQIASAR